MQSASKREVLVYCPKCSVQNPLDEALLGTSVICIKCGHPFVAKKPKTKSSIFNNIWVRGLCVIVTLFVAILVKDTVSELINNITPRGKEKKDYALIMKSIDEYTIRFRQYGQAVRGTVDIYGSQTGEELSGKKDPKKYRQAIEQALEEAKRLHSWCEQKLTTFKSQALTKEGEKWESILREVYTSYYELSDSGIRLFGKTLELHRLTCGLRGCGSEKDKARWLAFLKQYKMDEELAKDELVKMHEELMQLVKAYKNFEEVKIESAKRIFNDESFRTKKQ